MAQRRWDDNDYAVTAVLLAGPWIVAQLGAMMTVTCFVVAALFLAICIFLGRLRFRIHLLTSLVLMLAGSLVVGLNFRRAQAHLYGWPVVVYTGQDIDAAALFTDVIVGLCLLVIVGAYTEYRFRR